MKVPVPVKPSRMWTPSSVRPWPNSLAEHLVGGPEDEVDDLDRGVDDAELVDGLLERGGEELVVELDDDALAALGVVDALGALADRVVELLQGGVLGVEGVLVEDVEHPLHGLGDRVVRGEVVALEEGVEDRAGDEVLGEHLDGVVAGDAVVEVAAQAVEERVELFGHGVESPGRRAAR